jgi:putative transcriptional regulator
MKSFDIDASCYKANGDYANAQTNHITMRNINKLHLSEVKEYTPAKIIRIRKKVRLSQAALAKVFNISPSAVRQWEVGDKRPSGASKKLYDLIERKGLEVLI